MINTIMFHSHFNFNLNRSKERYNNIKKQQTKEKRYQDIYKVLTWVSTELQVTI